MAGATISSLGVPSKYGSAERVPLNLTELALA